MQNIVLHFKQLFIELDNLPQDVKSLLIGFLNSTPEEQKEFLKIFDNVSNSDSQNLNSDKN